MKAVIREFKTPCGVRRRPDHQGRFSVDVHDRVADRHYVSTEALEFLSAARTKATLQGVALVRRYGQRVNYVAKVFDEDTGRVVWMDEEAPDGLGVVSFEEVAISAS